jgi:hypothetical protein
MLPQPKKQVAKTPGLSFAILKTIGGSGGVAARSIRHNAVRIFDSLVDELLSEKRPAYRINYAVRRLRERGWIKLTRGNNGRRYALTADGEAALAKYELKQNTIPAPRRWDKKWRIVIFDVREKRRACRDAIREALREFGFKHLHDSVWIFPYPCDDIVELAKTAYGVRHDAIYLVCDRFVGDEWLAFDFNLGLAPYG